MPPTAIRWMSRSPAMTFVMRAIVPMPNRWSPPPASLPAFDEHHAELRVFVVEQPAEHHEVALFEDPQRQGRVREEHRAEREHRDVRHASSQPAFATGRSGMCPDSQVRALSRLTR